MTGRTRGPAGGEPVRRNVARALRLRCPVCGKGKMFSNWFKLNDHCTSCNFRFDRNEPDYFIGAYTINLIVSELIVVGVMLGVIWATWPAVPWKRMTWTLIGLMVPAPLITYPFSKSLWLALDLAFQPPKDSEFSDATATEKAKANG